MCRDNTILIPSKAIESASFLVKIKGVGYLGSTVLVRGYIYFLRDPSFNQFQNYNFRVQDFEVKMYSSKSQKL